MRRKEKGKGKKNDKEKIERETKKGGKTGGKTGGNLYNEQDRGKKERHGKGKEIERGK